MDAGEGSSALLPMSAQADEATPLLPKAFDDVADLDWSGSRTAAGTPALSGSIFASAMNLAACAFGASMLSLPYVLFSSGPIWGLVLIFLFAHVAVLASEAIVEAGKHVKRSSYSGIVKSLYGEGAAAVSECLLSICLLVAAISYIVGLADILPNILPSSSVLQRSSRIVLLVLILFGPTLVSNLSLFGPASALAIAGCYVLAGCVVLELFVTTSDSDTWVFPHFSILASLRPKGILYSLPLTCFVYAYHYIYTETISELKNPTSTRIAWVNYSTMAVLLGCYLPFCVAGYLNMSGSHITPNILNGLPSGSLIVYVGQLAIGALLVLTYALLVIPLRRRGEELLYRQQTSEVDFRRIIVAGVLCAVVGACSVILPDLGLANAIAGGCIALVMFLYPGLFTLSMEFSKVAPRRSVHRLLKGFFLVVLGLAVCFLGLFGSFITTDW